MRAPQLAGVVKPLEKRMEAYVNAAFRTWMGALVEAGEEPCILDLRQVDFVDYRGLAAIVASLKMLGGKGDLVVAGASEKIMNLFRLTRMDRVFEIFPSSEEALEKKELK